MGRQSVRQWMATFGSTGARYMRAEDRHVEQGNGMLLNIGDQTMRKILSILGMMITMNFVGCDDFSPLNTSPPSYIKNVAAYKEGSDGLIVYFVLSDKDGEMTTASGTLKLDLSENKTVYSYNGIIEHTSVLFSTTVAVNQADFRRATVGMGAFQHRIVMYTFGRITYDQFRFAPREQMGKATVQFKANDGKLLKGEDTILF